MTVFEKINAEIQALEKQILFLQNIRAEEVDKQPHHRNLILLKWIWTELSVHEFALSKLKSLQEASEADAK